MVALIETLSLALSIYVWMVIIAVLFSWLYAFNIVNPHNPIVNMVGTFVDRVTEPALRPIRRVLPDLGGIDISPIILLLIIYFLQRFLATTVLRLVI